MSEPLGQTIEAAVDSAVKAHSTPGQESTSTPAPTTTTTDSPAAAGLPAAPATDSGDESDSPSRKEGAPTTQGADDEILRDEKWLTLERRRTILTNARTKAATEERERLLSDLGIPAAELEAAREHTRAMYADPVAYYRSFGDMLRRAGMLPDEGPQPRASAEPTAQQAAAALADFELPDPTFRTADGRGVYSRDDMQAIVKGLIGHVKSMVGQEVKPISEAYQRYEVEQLTLKAQGEASNEFAEAARTWPRFKELAPRMRDLFAAERRRGNTRYTLRDAYNAAYVQQDLEDAPIREAETRERLAHESQQRPKPDIVVPGANAVRESGKTKGPRSIDQQWDEAIGNAARKHGVTLTR